MHGAAWWSSRARALEYLHKNRLVAIMFWLYIKNIIKYLCLNFHSIWTVTLEMTRIGSWGPFFCGDHPRVISVNTPGRPNFEPSVLKEVQDHHRSQGSHQEGDKSHSSVCVQERHGQFRAACREMHGAKWWSSRAHALELTRTGWSPSCFGNIFRI